MTWLAVLLAFWAVVATVSAYLWRRQAHRWAEALILERAVRQLDAWAEGIRRSRVGRN